MAYKCPYNRGDLTKPAFRFHALLDSFVVLQQFCDIGEKKTYFLKHVWNTDINPLKPELNPICYLLALLAHHFLHVSRIRVKSLTLRLLMSYIYGVPILAVSGSHTTTQHSR